MKKTILILAANPKGTTKLNLTKEVKQIAKELQRLQRDKQFVLKPYWAVTPDDVRHALLDHKPHFVHFSGHGAAEQGIVLENEAGEIQLLDTDALAKVFEPNANRIECVTLNACYSALQVSAILKHIHYVIGMNKPIKDKAAIQFVCGFYDALAAGKSIETAFKMKRYSIKAATPTATEHLKPVLKTRYDTTAWNVPVPPNPFFTGRETLLGQLQETLHFRQAAALSGLGGMGKTQTAAFYAYQHRHEYQAILWVLADTVEVLKDGLAALAQPLDLPEKYAYKQQDMIKAVQHWLATQNDWLLILDNADNLSVVSYLDRRDLGLGSGGDLGGCRHLLLTTGARITEPFAQRVEIKALSLEDGIEFLLRRATDIPAEELKYAFADETREIVEALGSLPLALDQAGAYIRETQCGLDGYLERYHTHAPKLLAKSGTQASQHSLPDAVVKTWLLSFEKIADENPTAVAVLYLCAFLHPDKIPEEIFKDSAPIVLDDVPTVIFKYSLLHREPKTKMLSIHRVVQLILKHGMDEAEQRIWAEKAVRAVDSAFPSGNFKFSEWNQCERLLLCAQTCAALIDEWVFEFEEAACLLHQTAFYLKEKAEYTQAKPLYERALAIWEKVHGKEHPLVATSLNNIAELYRAKGAYEQALPLNVRALAIDEKVYGIVHPDVANDLNNIAFLYYTQGAYEQALPLYGQALAIREKVLSKEDPLIAKSLNNLAELYRAQGMYEQAKPLYERALAIFEKVHGNEHPLVATSLNNLAVLYKLQGAYEQAKQLNERALAIFEKVHGKEHPDVATSLNNLAELYRAQGEYEQALLLYGRALATREKMLGKEHPDVASSLNNLAELYRAKGAYEQAKPLYERALVIFEKVHGKEYPLVASCLNNLALLYKAQGAYGQALPLYKRALAIWEKVHGKEHPDVATSLNNLAELYRAQGEYEKALPLYQQALAIDEKVYGINHPEVATDLNNLAFLYHSQGAYEQAKPLYEQVLKIFKQVFKPDHPNVRVVSENYASLLEKMEKT
jgi:tetratricopeptide (TPR) repeat protein